MRSFLRQFLALILGGMIIVSGLVYIYFYLNNHNPINNKTYFHVPVKQELNLAAGFYTIFYEYDIRKVDLGPIHLSKSEKMTNTSSLLDIKITNSSDSSDVSIINDLTYSYTIKNNKAESLYRFKINQPALYTVSIQYRNPEMKTPLTLTLIYNLGAFLSGAFKAIGIAILIALPFLLIGWYCYVKERRRKRTLAVTTAELN